MQRSICTLEACVWWTAHQLQLGVALALQLLPQLLLLSRQLLLCALRQCLPPALVVRFRYAPADNQGWAASGAGGW